MSNNPRFFSQDYVKTYGILFNENTFSENEEPVGILYDSPSKTGGKPFTGLLYTLYPNGNIGYYSIYKNGFEDGETVAFYECGQPSKYSIIHKGGFVGTSYQWYENGNLKKKLERYDDSWHYKYIEYDEDGNITNQGGV